MRSRAWVFSVQGVRGPMNLAPARQGEGRGGELPAKGGVDAGRDLCVLILHQHAVRALPLAAVEISCVGPNCRVAWRPDRCPVPAVLVNRERGQAALAVRLACADPDDRGADVVYADLLADQVQGLVVALAYVLYHRYSCPCRPPGAVRAAPQAQSPGIAFRRCRGGPPAKGTVGQESQASVETVSPASLTRQQPSRMRVSPSQSPQSLYPP